MPRRRFASVLTLLLGTWMLALASPAAAAPVVGMAHSQARVCAVAAPGFAACDALVVTDAAKGQPLATAAYSNGLAPAQLATAYGRGTGTPLVAVVDAYANPNAVQDLNAYRTQFGLGLASLTQVDQNGGSIGNVGGNVGWGQEEMLDLEMVSAICPSCRILYVGAKSSSFTDLAAAVTQAHTQGANYISNSYGAPEFRTEGSWTQWNITGAVVTVSAGDSGFGVEFPAASQGVVAVGGTTLKLKSDNTRDSETVWSGTGSGCSSYIAKPSWQHDLGCSKRTVADIAAVADPATGVAVYDSYGSTGGANWYIFGGTSVSSPIVAAIFTTYGGTSAANLYSATSGLYDVTSGSNGRCSTPKTLAKAYLCTGIVGYDGPTGNGTPNRAAGPFSLPTP
jgi:subtilase family serine protease